MVSFQKTSGEKYIKNLSNKKITDVQIKLISHGLKFIPVNKLNKNRIRRNYCRILRFSQDECVLNTSSMDAIETFTLSTLNQTGIHQFKNQSPSKATLRRLNYNYGNTNNQPKQNLSRNEQKALNELKQNNDINLKNADKGSTTVVMNKTDKIKEGENLLNNEQSYRRLTEPMVKGTHNKVLHL